MNKIIVLVTKGKKEYIYSAKVHLFDLLPDASSFIERTINLNGKYWTKAEIIEECEEIIHKCKEV